MLFAPESAYGPTNNCVGIGAELLARGHRVVFAAEASWAGRLAPLGFEERLIDLTPPGDGGGPAPDPDPGGPDPDPGGPDSPDSPRGPGGPDPGAFWKEFIAATAPEFRKPPIEQLETFMVPTWRALVDGARYSEPQLRAVLDEVRPDVVVEDNVVCFPALVDSPAPFLRIVSCNPLELRGPGRPPPYSGLPAGDNAGWAEFAAEYDRTHRPLWAEFDAWVREQGVPGLPDLEFLPATPRPGMYLYPAELDYPPPVAGEWIRLDSCVRRTERDLELPPLLTDRPPGSALVYLSLGSLGSADVALMARLVGILADTPHRYLVSTGPRHAEYELAPNMWGAEQLPQTRLLPQVDLVITHGGNNTTTEAVHAGVPMIVLPLFWDQHDNAQRVAGSGFGLRLPTYTCSAAEFHAAVDRLLADRPLRSRVAAAGRAVRARDGLRRAADVVERVARGRRPVS